MTICLEEAVSDDDDDDDDECDDTVMEETRSEESESVRTGSVRRVTRVSLSHSQRDLAAQVVGVMHQV